MSNTSATALVQGDNSSFEVLAGGTVGVAAVVFCLGLAALFEGLSVMAPVSGVPLQVLLGYLLVGLGLVVAGLGFASRYGLVPTDPSPSAGLVPAIAFSGLGFVTGGLVGSQTLGLGTLGWLPIAVVVGGALFALTVFPREDLGSTIGPALLGTVTGLVLLTGVLGADWAWTPAGLPSSNAVTFAPTAIVPGLLILCALLLGWSAAKAYGGFGATGRHIGAYLLIYLVTLSIIGVLVGLVLFVVLKGFPAVVDGVAIGAASGPTWTVSLFGYSLSVDMPVSWPFLSNGMSLYAEVDGVLPAIVGTVWLVVGAVLFAVPLGVGAAVFLAEYASEGRFTQLVEIATNGLWSTPSIVFGLFGFAFLVPRFGNQKSLISGMLTLGFMLLPLVVITSRESMLAVPDEYRDASAALGVSKWQTIRSVVLPAAIPGIVTGIILGIGRIAGETAPILLTMAGATFTPASQTVDVIGGFEFIAAPPFVANEALLEATSALPYQLYAIITAGVGGNQINDPSGFAWGTTLVLLSVVLAFYAVGILTRHYFRQRVHHE
jgi:phosphate transport system permease protein